MSASYHAARPRLLPPWVVAVIVFVLLAGLGVAYTATRTQVEVRVIRPEYTNIASTVSTTGEVVPVHDFPAKANFSGLVDRIYVHLGEKVHAGENLIRMKDQYAVPRLDRARAVLDQAKLDEQNVLQNGSRDERMSTEIDLQKAEFEERQAQQSLASMRQLAKGGDVSPAEVEAAQERLTTATASLRALQQKLNGRYTQQDIEAQKALVNADKATVAAEEVSYANANVTSPISGTVYLLPVHLWDFVPAGNDLLHVADLSKVDIRADFDEPDVGKLRVGAPVEITWDGAPGHIWHGHLHDKPLAVARAGARTVGECDIDIDDDHGQLPLDTNVAVVVDVQKHEHVLTVPREAVYTDGANQFAYVVHDEKVKKVSVTTGLANAMRIEITNGLTPQDQVVIHAVNGDRLSDGLKVKIVK